MKRVIVVFLSCFVMLFLFACKDAQENKEATLSSEYMDNYAYVVEQIDIGDFGDSHVHAIAVHNDRVFLFYERQNSAGHHSLAIMSVSSDNHDVMRTDISPVSIRNVAGMRITVDNRITLLATQWLFPQDDTTVFYAEYDFEGNELFRKDFGNLLPTLNNHHVVRQAVFIDDSGIVLSLEHDHGNAIYILNLESDTVIALQLNNRLLNNNHIVKLTDGRILVFDTETNELFSENVFLRDLDLVNNKWGNTHPIIGHHATNLFPAHEIAPFDLLISDNNSLYGYSLETNEQMALLRWGGIELLNTSDAFVGMFGDGRLVVVTRGWDLSVEMFYLTPVQRGYLQTTEKVTLTLGGLRIPDEILSAVIEFNQENRDYRIEVVDYLGPDYDWYGGLTRLQVELMTGKGPDLIYDWSRELRAPGFLLDLYTFIDADSELNREDFLPNILHAMEDSDGCLYRIANSYSVNTMIGIEENLGHIDAWTLTRMQELLEDSLHIPYPLGVLNIGLLFVHQMLGNRDFIDYDNYQANLDNDCFVKILEIAKLLPAEQNLEIGYTSALILMMRGEQLLEEKQFDYFRDFQGYAEVLGDSFVLLGMPSAEGGRNIVYPLNPIGIGAASAYADGAWEFLRRFLLPIEIPDKDDALGNVPFPIRIDTFEAHIEYLQTPLVGPDGNGNPVEYPRWEFTLIEWVDNRYLTTDVDLYAMTDDVADKLRDFIKSAQPPARRLDSGLTGLINGDLHALFDGVRSSEDTARIIQSRVQIYLSEQELLDG